MTTSKNFPTRKFVKGPSMKSGLFAACLLAATSLIAALPMSSSATAGDLDPQVQDISDSRFVRMGLNKSIIVKLPAEARDVVIGNEQIVDAVIRRKNMAYLFARRTGQTNIFFFDADGQQILSLDLEVAQDTVALKKLMSRALPGHKITIDSANDNLILGGVARNAMEAKMAHDLASQFASDNSLFGASGGSVINTMTVEGEDQVMLKVKVVEIQRDVLKQMGVDLSAMLDFGKVAVKLSSVNPFSRNLLSSFQGYQAAAASGGSYIQPLLRAMESDGLVRTLAEPNLTALTGATADFEAGGEFPYQTCERDDSGETCRTEFKKYGIKVKFTPTVLSEGRINIQINTESTELSSILAGNEFANVPGTTTRKASTTLEMPSGGTMMLAGLIRETSRHTINGTPGLKKLPVLGTLFRSRDFAANETELVIIATPYLVRHTSENQLASPDDGLNIATEKQAVFMGKLNKTFGNGDAPAGSYNGNVGFIVE